MVHCDEMDLGFTHAMTTGGRWNGSCQDFQISDSSYDMQIADWEGCYGVATVNVVG